MEILELEAKGQSIKATNFVKYLGVYLDRNLTFQEVKHILRKMACGIKTIFSIRKRFPKNKTKFYRFDISSGQDLLFTTGSIDKPGTAQVGAPLKVQKSFSHIQKYTFVDISTILQRQIIPQGIRIRLENHFFYNWRQQNLSKN